ncbi:MAG: hypothetical protein MUF73_01905 [Rhodobacteraceae bacterium]|jgi:hypothetical protein|nr:hypothetical protein [Paracoccaceae bacterium]
MALAQTPNAAKGWLAHCSFRQAHPPHRHGTDLPPHRRVGDPVIARRQHGPGQDDRQDRVAFRRSRGAARGRAWPRNGPAVWPCNQGLRQAIIVVRERSIDFSLADEPPSKFGFWTALMV